MNKLLTLLLLAVCLTSLTACGPMEPQAVEATVAITPNVKTDACLAFFTRTSPNLCLRSGDAFAVTFTNAQACTAQTTGLSLPAGKTVIAKILYQAISGNAVTNRSNELDIWTDSACTQNKKVSFANIREFVATAAGSDIGWESDIVIFQLSNVADTFYTSFGSLPVCNGCVRVGSFYILGYYD